MNNKFKIGDNVKIRKTCAFHGGEITKVTEVFTKSVCLEIDNGLFEFPKEGLIKIGFNYYLPVINKYLYSIALYGLMAYFFITCSPNDLLFFSGIVYSSIVVWCEDTIFSKLKCFKKEE